MIIHKLKDESGSSSILVIILMVVLMVFGLAVLTTSLSNVRLAEKKRQWLKDYYQLEGIVEKEIGTIDQLLIQGHNDASLYIREKNHVEDFDLPVTIDEDTLYAIHSYVYRDYVIQSLTEYIDGDSEMTLTVSDFTVDEALKGEFAEDCKVTFDKTLDNGDFPKHIKVTMNIIIPDMDILKNKELTSNRFSIPKYIEWQNPFEYEDALDFGDPFGEITFEE